MTIREDILVELTMVPITKNIGEPGQGDLNILKAEHAEWVAKIKTTEDMVEQGHKYGFLILILVKEQYWRVIGNEHLQWKNPEDLGGYNDSIQAKDTAFDWSKSDARRLLGYE